MKKRQIIYGIVAGVGLYVAITPFPLPWPVWFHALRGFSIGIFVCAFADLIAVTVKETP